jgi:hypothetical protein
VSEGSQTTKTEIRASRCEGRALIGAVVAAEILRKLRGCEEIIPRATGMECGNASYRSDCFCSCSNPWLVQSRLVHERKLDLLALQGEQKQ